MLFSSATMTTQSETHRAITATWKIEQPRLIAGLTRMVRDISLAEAHSVIVAAENRLLEAFPSADIIIHPDPRGLAEKHGGLFAESVEG